MLKKFSFLFFFLSAALCAEEDLEVLLSTKVHLRPVYLTELRIGREQIDWRYPEELRAVLAYDIANNGQCSVTPVRLDWEKKFFWPDPRARFDLAFWNREKIPFVVAVQASQDSFSATVFHIQRGTSKNYPDIPLTGDAQTDRHEIHLLADAIQKDLFGVAGIASQRILFSQRVKNTGTSGPEWLSDIWIADWDGANAKRLTMARGYCITPAFMPEKIALSGDEYYYVSSDGGQTKIFRSSSDGRSNPMIRLRGSQLLPAISKNGEQIAFISDAAGRPDLFVQNLDKEGKQIGRARQLFSAPFATQASPTYAPDGHKLAFVSDKDGTPRIYVMDIQDARSTRRVVPKLLTRKNRQNTSPSWSPDGSKLAYSALTDGIRQIWIYDFASDQEWQLTFGHENKENPSWASNSLHLIYNTETRDVSELYIINLHQQQLVQISTGFGQKRFPSWETR
jgi:TolB protein